MRYKKFWLVVLLASSHMAVPALGAPASHSNNVPDKLERIEQKLDELLAVTNTCTMSGFLSGDCDESPVDTTVSFCFSQGSALEAAMGYGLGLETSLSAGVGNSTVVDIAATVGVTGPLVPAIVIPLLPPPLPPIGPPLIGPPLPTEASLGAGVELARAHEVCMDIPIEIPQESLEEVRVLLGDVNDVYQNRLQRVLGFGTRVASRREFIQCAGDAFENILTQQIESFDPDDRSGFLGDPKIQGLIDCVEIPTSLANAVNDNGALIFERIDTIKDDVVARDEYTLITDAITTIQGLPDEILEAIQEIGGDLGDVANETPAQRKARFCNTTRGQRRAFDRYCGR